ncbi:MAG: YdcF family protein [Candidatus Paceibacterota bacterium]|jgi:uncharacterized SAM-binding protein YcdF (DUF218 family)
MNEVDRLAKIIWDYMLMHQELKPMDAVFGLGSNDTRVAERAADLFLQGYGQYLIFSGGWGKKTKFQEPEAVVFGDIALKKGVPADKIILEPKASNTGDNIVFVKKLLAEKGLNLKSFILVQKPYMERRTFATFKKQWPEAECLVTSPQVSYGEYFNGDEEYRDKFVNVMVGDLQRIKEYPKLGFQIEQEIPDEIWQAYKGLIALGYDKYFISSPD